jgi:hypothetical protein
MAADEKEATRGFTVVDRRGGSEETPQAQAPEPPPAGALPPVDFTSLCLSLATSALYHLGVVGDPETGSPPPAPDLPLARHTIDTLAMLQEKTRGNLDPEEERMLEGLLYELHLRFVEAGEGKAGKAPPE